MKHVFARSIALALAMLMILSALFSCAEVTESEPSDTEAGAETEVPTEAVDEYGRLLVPSAIPEDLSFPDTTVTVLCRDHSAIMDTLSEFYSQAMNSEPVNDAVFERNRQVEAQLGVTLDFYTIDSEAIEPYETAVRKDWQGGDGAFDLMGYYAYYGVSMAMEGYLTNLLNLSYTDLSKPWWSQDFNEEMTLCDQLYFTVGDLSLTATKCTNAIFFNKKKLEDMFPGKDLYAVVQNGDWTLDTFGEIISACYFDLNGNGQTDRDDQYGAVLSAVSIPVDAYIFALGCHLTEKDEDGIPTMTFYQDHTIDAFDKLFDIIIHNPGSLTGPCDMDTYYEAQEKFTDSETLFLLDIFQATDILRGTTVDYGVLPLFKYDKQQDGYYTCTHDSFSLLSIYAGTKNLDATDAVMELMAQKSYEKVTPAYFFLSLKQKYSQTLQDAQMFDLTQAGRRFEFGLVYSYEIGNPTHLWRMIIQNKTNTLASQLKSTSRQYASSLNKLVRKYEKKASA